MKINFGNKKVRNLCERQDTAKKELEVACARKLRSRLSDLEAAGCITDLVAGNPHPLKGNRTGQFALDLTGGLRLVFTPDHSPCPIRSDGGIDWSQVINVCIEYIGDYHD